MQCATESLLFFGPFGERSGDMTAFAALSVDPFMYIPMAIGAVERLKFVLIVFMTFITRHIIVFPGQSEAGRSFVIKVDIVHRQWRVTTSALIP